MPVMPSASKARAESNADGVSEIGGWPEFGGVRFGLITSAIWGAAMSCRPLSREGGREFLSASLSSFGRSFFQEAAFGA